MAEKVTDIFLRKRPGEQRRGVVIDRLSGKLAKTDSGYRPAGHETKAMCAECTHFLLPGNSVSSCRRVAGIVQHDGVCDLFTPREAEGTARASGTAEEQEQSE